MNDLRSVDLNLLVILDVLLEEAHVSRAAIRLHLSQPAASSALDRLRHLFGDRLLERSRGGMRLTPVAEALRVPLRDALGSIATLVRRDGTDLATARQTVRVVVADTLAMMLLPALHTRLVRTAPGVTLVVLPWRGGTEAVRQLAAGEVELAASVLPTLDPAFRKVPLFDEHYVVAMRSDHPIVQGFCLHSWLDYPHVVVSGSGGTTAGLDTALAARNLSRRVGVVVPSFIMVPPLLSGSDLVALLPSRCVTSDVATMLATFVPPVPVDGFRLDLAWHMRRDGDLVVRHVADEMRALLAQ